MGRFKKIRLNNNKKHGDVLYILDTETSAMLDESDPIYTGWLGDGNTADDNADTETIAMLARRVAAKTLKEKVKNKTSLTKGEQSILFEAMLDLLS